MEKIRASIFARKINQERIQIAGFITIATPIFERNKND